MKAEYVRQWNYATNENPVLAECPKCNTKGPCAMAEHFYFEIDKFALRCKACKHIWCIERDAEVELVEPIRI